MDPNLGAQLKKHGSAIGPFRARVVIESFHKGQETAYGHFRVLLDGYFAKLLDTFPMDSTDSELLLTIRKDLLDNLQEMWNGVLFRRLEIKGLLNDEIYPPSK
jgi:hypothetical protein